MPGPSIDFTKWLTRLGFKYDEEPPVIRTVQPVAIVADHRHLVSHASLCSYLVGGEPVGGAVDFACILGIAVAPLRVNWSTAATANVGHHALLGLPGVAPPVVAGPTVLVPQLFQGQAAAARWVMGSTASNGGTGVPSWRHAANTNFGPLTYDVFVPAGGWILIVQTVALNTLYAAIRVDELPNEFAQ